MTHLTREVLEIVADISKQALQMPLANSAQCYKGVVNYHKGISSFVGLPVSLQLLTYCTVSILSDCQVAIITPSSSDLKGHLN